MDDHTQGQKFFGYVIGSGADLANTKRDNERDTIFITELKRSDEIRQQLKELNVPEDRIAYL